jgi:twinkle protein
MVARLSLIERLLVYGIRLKSYAAGTRKITCPKCSHTRRNKADPCLSVTIDGVAATWHCHHCGWSGGVRERDPVPKGDRRRPRRRPSENPGALTPQVLRWLAERGISEAVARRNRLGWARHYIAKLGGQVDCIAFPYYRDGELINVKYRALSEKAFAQEKDAEQLFYGIDDLAPNDEDLIIVEGEPDKLALEEAGYRKVWSVPDGAPQRLRDEPGEDDPKFGYLANDAERLEPLARIILAVDSDAKGRVLEEELARRIGKERCWRVRWPDGGDVQCKDANETLVLHGREVVRECIEAAEPYPISGLYSVYDFYDAVMSLYDHGRRRGLSTGWPALDELMTIAPGQLSVVTGIPNHGKSEFVDALMINLAQPSGWRFAVCSFENGPDEHLAKLAEKHLGAPFFDGPTRRMSLNEFGEAMAWLHDHFEFIRTDDEAPTIDWIMERARIAVLRHGVRGLVVDPYNEVEHQRPPGMTETEYISQLLGKLKRFAQNHGVHIWIVAHPVKLPRENGKLPVPTLYDISGSANWANKADVGLAVHRNSPDTNLVGIYVHKVRFKWVGKTGQIDLQYDRITGRYSEVRQRDYPSRYSD